MNRGQSFMANSGGGALACAKEEEEALQALKEPTFLESGDQPLFLLWASCPRSRARKQAPPPPCRAIEIVW